MGFNGVPGVPANDAPPPRVQKLFNQISVINVRMNEMNNRFDSLGYFEKQVTEIKREVQSINSKHFTNKQF